jgi:hypothetical protein
MSMKKCMSIYDDSIQAPHEADPNDPGIIGMMVEEQGQRATAG